MLGSASEVHYETGLLIWRGAFDAGVARDFAAESMSFLEYIRRGEGLPTDQVYSYGARADLLHGWGGGATCHVLQSLGKISSRIGVNLNYQPEGAVQEFHPDTALYAIIVHASDNGGFDLSPAATTPDQAEKDFTPYKLSAGDVLMQLKPHLFHRGYNRGDDPRITAVIRPMIPDLDQRF